MMEEEQVLIFGSSGDVARLDFGDVTDGEYIQRMDNIFESLVEYESGSTDIKPGLATSWKISPDGKEITFFAMFIAVVVGTFAGIVSASKQYSFLDYTTMGVALFDVSMPVFWLGIMLMMIFSVFLRWLPIGGRIDTLIPFQRLTGLYLLDSVLTLNGPAFVSALRYLILPSVALATIPMATIARVTRSSMLEVLRKDYIRTERAKGLSERAVIYKHAARNAFLPVVTVIGLNFGLLLAGAILTETIFAWPGIGRYVVKAVQMRDYPAVQGCVLFFAFMFVIVNLITDITYAFIDPRIKYE